MNKSGFKPCEYKVVIKPESEERVTDGGIIIPETAAEKEDYAKDIGVIVGVGPLAFEGWGEDLPVVGDTVLFAKYGGQRVKGKDGEIYRIIQDKDLVAICEVEK